MHNSTKLCSEPVCHGQTNIAMMRARENLYLRSTALGSVPYNAGAGGATIAPAEHLPNQQGCPFVSQLYTFCFAKLSMNKIIIFKHLRKLRRDLKSGTIRDGGC
jgi:hypothetical protein